MESANHLLSDKYVEFASKIMSLWFQKKLTLEELAGPRLSREEHNGLLNKMRIIENLALEYQQEFEDWKQECLNNTTDG